MTHAAARLVLLVAGLLVAGCSGVGVIHRSPDGPGAARTPAGQALAPQAAMERAVVGRSTKAELAAALGEAIAIPFDSGYEVWVYRWPGADTTTRAATELVLLFEPGGTLAKVRLRPGYKPPP